MIDKQAAHALVVILSFLLPLQRYKERSEIEALFFATNTQLSQLKQPSFVPPEGVSLYALQKAWDALEKAEHGREVALRSELLRLERLEQLAYKFERKVPEALL